MVPTTLCNIIQHYEYYNEDFNFGHVEYLHLIYIIC